MSPRQAAMLRVVFAGLAALAALAVLGCAATPPPGAQDPQTGSPQPESPELENPELAGPELDFERLQSLASDFYDRLENRRFNSLATFQDPGLRQFFRTRAAYSDYYAELAYELESTRFEASRPTRVEVEDTTRESAARVRMRVRFTGDNGLPLRWWDVDLLREDVWEIDETGRWWIVPGKV